MWRNSILVLWLCLCLGALQSLYGQGHPDAVRSRLMGLRVHGGLQTLPYVNDVSCFGFADGEVGYAFVGGGIAPYTYSIDGLTWGTTPYFSGLGPGIYVITVMDSAGTTASDTLTVAEPPLLDVQAQVTPSLCSNFDGAIQLVTTGGISPYVYQWGNGSVDSSLTGLNPGTYYVTVIDNNYCRDSLTITLQPNGTAPVVTVLDSGDISCFGANDGYLYVQASGGTGALTYQWIPQQSGSQDSLQGLAAGNYNLTVTDSVGCIARVLLSVSEPAELVLTGGMQPPICAGDSNGLAFATASGGTPGYVIQWLPSGLTADSLTGLAAGTFTAVAMDANGCTDSLPMTLVDPPQLVADFISNPALPVTLGTAVASVSFMVQSPTAVAYQWAWGDGTQDTGANPTHFFGGPGDYCISLTVTDSAGCTDSTVRCGLRVVSLDLEIPNTFTPNGDSRNDVFLIQGLDQFPQNKLEVFNRWGNRVFEMDSYDNTWDGRHGDSGAALPDGAYFFVLHPNASGFTDIMGEIVIVR